MVEGKKPFIYARNVNIGITAARREDNPDAVILLNDDALLLTPLGFTHLAEAAAKHPEYGIVSAVTNFAGNAAQIAKNVGFREEPNMLCFIAVLITAACLDRVGPLDERFTAYGWEDNDFCRRARQAGFKLGIYDLCFVDHRTLVSTFREDVHCGISAGAAIYREKWGDLA
jgi:GT2 family glycosyltransferase